MKTILVAVLIIYLCVGIFLYVKQRSLIYFPVAEIPTVLKSQSFENDGHEIKVSVLNESRKKAIIYFGGNAEHVDQNTGAFSKEFSNYSVYLVKYRGYAGSTGTPTEEAIYSDALYIYDELKKSHDAISIIGRSLGSAVATYVASNRQIEKLVLITPFDSVQSVAQSQFPIYPMEFMLRDKHDSLSRVKDIEAETLIMAAEQDRVIRMKHTHQLLSGFSKDVLFHLVEGANHNNISNDPKYYDVLKEFL